MPVSGKEAGHMMAVLAANIQWDEIELTSGIRNLFYQKPARVGQILTELIQKEGLLIPNDDIPVALINGDVFWDKRKEFDAHEFFQKFGTGFGATDPDLPAEDVVKGTGKVYACTKDVSNSRAFTYLPPNYRFRNRLNALARAAAMVEQQLNGEEGDLTVDGSWNIFCFEKSAVVLAWVGDDKPNWLVVGMDLSNKDGKGGFTVGTRFIVPDFE